jgi:hypothetical protein
MKNSIKNMKPRNRIKKHVRKVVRTTVAIADAIHDKGIARAEKLNRGNFSAYVEDLIAADVASNGKVAA